MIGKVAAPRRGGLVSFLGTVRGTEKGRRIPAIVYEAYAPMAERKIGAIVRRAAKRWKVAAAVRHRIGRVRAGEPSIVIACAGIHRKEAFAACAWIIDEIKRRVPIWKTFPAAVRELGKGTVLRKGKRRPGGARRSGRGRRG